MLKKQRELIAEGALERLKANVTQATETLLRLLDSENDSIRRGAGNDIHGYYFKRQELDHLEERMSSLEASIARQKRNRL